MADNDQALNGPAAKGSVDDRFCDVFDSLNLSDIAIQASCKRLNKSRKREDVRVEIQETDSVVKLLTDMWEGRKEFRRLTDQEICRLCEEMKDDVKDLKVPVSFKEKRTKKSVRKHYVPGSQKMLLDDALALCSDEEKPDCEEFCDKFHDQMERDERRRVGRERKLDADAIKKNGTIHRINTPDDVFASLVKSVKYRMISFQQEKPDKLLVKGEDRQNQQNHTNDGGFLKME